MRRRPKRLPWAFLGSLLLLLCAGSPAHGIVDGLPDGTTHPNVASIGIAFEDGWGHSCSGVLVGPRAVATSAHCTEVWQTFGEPVAVTFDPEPSGESQTYEVAAVHTHPGWTSRFLIRGNSKCGAYGQCGEDVGVVVLAKAPAGIAPATLPGLDTLSSLSKKQLLTGVGYGIQGFHPMFHPTGCCTRHVGLFRALPSREVTSDRYLKLAGEGTTAATFGDSGGPAFVGTSPTVAGLFSIHQAWAESPSYFYRLDTASALAFLGPFVTNSTT